MVGLKAIKVEFRASEYFELAESTTTAGIILCHARAPFNNNYLAQLTNRFLAVPKVSSL